MDVSQIRIDRQFTIHPVTDRKFNVGGYVRAIGRDKGTGMIVGIDDADMLDEKTNKVVHQRIYIVRWLDMNKGQEVSFEAEAAIASSARGVPKFDNPDDAEAWLEQQLQSGNWTGKAQDAVDSDSDWRNALEQWEQEMKGDDGHPDPE
jgi:hypothetical protein